MSGRVLNFLEFSDKYSNGSNEPLSVDDMTSASSNFEEGFDDTTYDQPQIGPNRPVAGNYEMTPASPGEEGTPAFSTNNSKEMSAPEESEEESEEEESEEESEEEESEEKEEGNPEAGANPKKKVEEGLTLVKGFAQFINENYHNGEDFQDSGDVIDELQNNEDFQELVKFFEENPRVAKLVNNALDTDLDARVEENYEYFDDTESQSRKISKKSYISRLLKSAGINGFVMAAMGSAMGSFSYSDVVQAALIAAGFAAGAGVIGPMTSGVSRKKIKPENSDEEYGSNPWEDDDCCSECGEVPISNEYGVSCGCNM